MNMTDQDFKHLTYISSGTFGSVFHNGKIAFKKYHPEIKAHFEFEYKIIKNPCLRPHPIKFRLMKYYNRHLKYTNLSCEPLYINQKFSGICYPYYDGDVLYNLKNISFIEKEDIVKQLLRNAKELTNHHIYPLDYKLDNIIYTKQGEIKIIDLDDPLTKYKLVRHPHLYQKSMVTLKDTVVHFLNLNREYHCHSLAPFLNHTQQIDSLCNGKTYRQLYNYLEIHSSKNNFLIIPPEQNVLQVISDIKRLMQQLEIKIIILESNTIPLETFQSFILLLIQEGIEVYDILPSTPNDVINYIKDYNVSKTFIIDKQKIKRR